MDLRTHQGEYRFKIHDMSCASCVLAIENALRSLPGAREVNVNFATRTATVKGNIATPAALEAIKQVGYTPVELGDAGEEFRAQEENSYYHLLLIQAALAFATGMFLMIADHLQWFPSLSLPEGQGVGILIGTVSLLVLIYTARDIYLAAWRAAQVHLANMDTLIAIGTGAAWLFSMVVVIFPTFFPPAGRQIYFEAALIIIAFIKFGTALEIRSRAKTRQSIEKLLDLQPKMAHVLRHEEELNIPVAEVIPNDVVYVRPGEQVPVDGIVLEGSSSVDESMFTGESTPVLREAGDALIGGSINKMGSLKYRATRVGKEMVLAKIVELISRAQSTKPKVARLADKVAAYFVPTVIALAIASALLWYDFGPEPKISYAVAVLATVLLIACPCAIGLATPLAIMVGLGRAAQAGILVRNGEALQKISTLSTIVLDKTGTITLGKPSISDVFAQPNWSRSQIIQYAASLEKNSEHALAEASVQQAQRENITLLPVERFHAIPGYGLSGVINGKVVLLGNAKLLQERNINMSDLKRADDFSLQGQSLVYLIVDGQAAGAIGINDSVKPDSKQAIARLKKMGLKVIMFTGDHERVAQAIAAQVDIQELSANLLPDEKVHKITELRTRGERVGMVGDGFNDAPALAEADAGFVMARGSDLAIETGDIILMSNSLNAVADAILISQATIKNIKENLFGALIYNAISIPVAAGLLYPIFGILLSPIIAGAVMALSSLTVVINASRLRFFKTTGKE